MAAWKIQRPGRRSSVILGLVRRVNRWQLDVSGPVPLPLRVFSFVTQTLTPLYPAGLPLARHLTSPAARPGATELARLAACGPGRCAIRLTSLGRVARWGIGWRSS